MAILSLLCQSYRVNGFDCQAARTYWICMQVFTWLFECYLWLILLFTVIYIRITQRRNKIHVTELTQSGCSECAYTHVCTHTRFSCTYVHSAHFGDCWPNEWFGISRLLFYGLSTARIKNLIFEQKCRKQDVTVNIEIHTTRLVMPGGCCTKRLQWGGSKGSLPSSVLSGGGVHWVGMGL